MTVLFGFASPLHGAAFLGGDDLESNRKVRVDKVLLAWRRFAVGVYGLDTLLEAVRFSVYGSHDAQVVRFSGGSEIRPVDSVHVLCERAAICIPRLAAMYRRNVAKQLADGNLSQRQRDQMLSSGGGLVVLDYETMQLHHARLRGQVLQEGSAATFDIETFPQDHAFRFAINEPLDIGAVSADMAAKPRRWCRPKVAAARLECERAGFPGTIGDLGASFTKRADQTEFFSAFASVDEYMTAYAVPPYPADTGTPKKK
jgi:hypothetical protein